MYVCVQMLYLTASTNFVEKQMVQTSVRCLPPLSRWFLFTDLSLHLLPKHHWHLGFKLWIPRTIFPPNKVNNKFNKVTNFLMQWEGSAYLWSVSVAVEKTARILVIYIILYTHFLLVTIKAIAGYTAKTWTTVKPTNANKPWPSWYTEKHAEDI